MQTYKYKFCDGTVSEVEINDEQYELLKKMDKEEKENNRRHIRQNVPLKVLLKKETGKNNEEAVK